MCVKIDAHTEEITRLTKQLGDKTAALETKDSELVEFQKGSKDEIDALKDQLNKLRASSESKVRTVFNVKFVRLTVRAKLDEHTEDIVKLMMELWEKNAAQETKTAELTGLQQISKVQIDDLKDRLNELRTSSEFKVRPVLNVKFMMLMVRYKVDEHSADISKLTKTLEEKTAAQEIKNAELIEFKKSSKLEIDELKDKIKTLRAASKSKVRCAFTSVR